MRLQPLVQLGVCLWLGALAAPPLIAQAPSPPSPPSVPSSPSAKSLDYETYRDRVQPVFLNKRRGFTRCYVCHSQGTPFRLQRLSAGSATWNEAETRKNFEAIQRLVAPGQPDSSRLLLMPLSHEAGGTEFHPGGKRWTAKSNPEWKEIAQWIRNASR